MIEIDDLLPSTKNENTESEVLTRIITVYRAQFNSIKKFVKLYRLMMSLWSETCNAISYYKKNKLIITQWDANEILIVVVLRQEQNKEIYIQLLQVRDIV
jgi:hypothetical protein